MLYLHNFRGVYRARDFVNILLTRIFLGSADFNKHAEAYIQRKHSSDKHCLNNKALRVELRQIFTVKFMHF